MPSGVSGPAEGAPGYAGKDLNVPMGIVRFRIVATHNRLPALAVADNALTGNLNLKSNMYPFVRSPKWSLIGPLLGESHLFVAPFSLHALGLVLGFVLLCSLYMRSIGRGGPLPYGTVRCRRGGLRGRTPPC